jgi:hypothetical protein
MVRFLPDERPIVAAARSEHGIEHEADRQDAASDHAMKSSGTQTSIPAPIATPATTCVVRNIPRADRVHERNATSVRP